MRQALKWSFDAFLGISPGPKGKPHLATLVQMFQDRVQKVVDRQMRFEGKGSKESGSAEPEGKRIVREMTERAIEGGRKSLESRSWYAQDKRKAGAPESEIRGWLDRIEGKDPICNFRQRWPSRGEMELLADARYRELYPPDLYPLENLLGTLQFQTNPELKAMGLAQAQRDGDRIVLKFPEPECLKWVQENMMDKLKLAVKEVFGVDEFSVVGLPKEQQSARAALESSA
jgi:hypothetical protein